MFLQTGAEFPWLPVGARVRFEQLHTMVDSRSGGKKKTYTLAIDLKRASGLRGEKRGKKCKAAQFAQVRERQQRNKRGSRKRRRGGGGKEEETDGGEKIAVAKNISKRGGQKKKKNNERADTHMMGGLYQ